MEGELNRMHSINRNKKENFYKYMSLNPVYFRDTFPNMTIEQAWEDVNKLKISKNMFTDFQGDMSWQEL